MIADLACFSTLLYGVRLCLAALLWLLGLGAGTEISCHSPGANCCKCHWPILKRIKRRVGWPTAAVMRLTWRFLPSLIVSFNQVVGMFFRSRIGGWRSHNQGGTATLTFAGRVMPSFSVTPVANNCSAFASGRPST